MVRNGRHAASREAECRDWPWRSRLDCYCNLDWATCQVTEKGIMLKGDSPSRATFFFFFFLFSSLNPCGLQALQCSKSSDTGFQLSVLIIGPNRGIASLWGRPALPDMPPCVSVSGAQRLAMANMSAHQSSVTGLLTALSRRGNTPAACDYSGVSLQCAGQL